MKTAGTRRSYYQWEASSLKALHWSVFNHSDDYPRGYLKNNIHRENLQTISSLKTAITAKLAAVSRDWLNVKSRRAFRAEIDIVSSIFITNTEIKR